MKVYTADKDARHIKTVRLWGLDVTRRATRVVLWFGAAKWGLGYVDVLNLLGPITSLKTRRIYGLGWIKFKEAS